MLSEVPGMDFNREVEANLDTIRSRRSAGALRSVEKRKTQVEELTALVTALIDRMDTIQAEVTALKGRLRRNA